MSPPVELKLSGVASFWQIWLEPMAEVCDMQCTSSSDEDSSMMTNMDDSVIPQCEGIPRLNWIGKCVVLQNGSGAAVAEGICCNVSSNDVIGSSGPLGDSHVAVPILSSLSKIDVLDE